MVDSYWSGPLGAACLLLITHICSGGFKVSSPVYVGANFLACALTRFS